VSDAVAVGRVGGVEFRLVRDGGRRLPVARDARVHRTLGEEEVRAGVCADDLRSISGMRVEREDAAPILRMVRALLNGRDQGADRDVLQGHLNQIKGFLPFTFTSSTKGDLQALRLPPSGAHLLLLHPLQGQPEEGGVQAAAGSHPGGWWRSRSIRSTRSAAIIIPAMIHI